MSNTFCPFDPYSVFLWHNDGDLNLSFATSEALLQTHQSFTIATWVYLSEADLNLDMTLKNENAITAFSQGSRLCSAFHLGIRSKLNGDTKTLPRWCFTLSPEKGDNDLHPCQNVFSSDVINQNSLNNWVFVVGVCDYESHFIKLSLPQVNNTMVTQLPNTWQPWNANYQSFVGCGTWEGLKVDLWPGRVRYVECFSKAFSDQEITLLHQLYLSHYYRG